VLVPRVSEAVTKALFKLKDAQATANVLASLRKEDVKNRVFGIEALAFADRTEFATALLPLLDDTRDAENIAPSGGSFFLRVRDLSVNAIAALTGLDFGFVVQRGERYTDKQAGAVRDRVKTK
jgi:hypothetical protein